MPDVEHAKSVVRRFLNGVDKGYYEPDQEIRVLIPALRVLVDEQETFEE